MKQRQANAQNAKNLSTLKQRPIVIAEPGEAA
jgi:hypothetical protein